MWWILVLLIGSAIAAPIEQTEVDDAYPEENPGLFEGDIELMPGQNPKDRNAQRNRNYRWPNGIIPYVISSSFSSSYQTAIHNAINMLQEKTKVNGKNCLTFKPRTNEHSYIQYQGGSGCHTPVGYHNRQSGVTLGRGCSRIGTIMHETMHAMGFWHEQSRPDRDSYVEIMWKNIMKGHEHNFDKYTTSQVDTLNLQYDYESVMHYSAYGFAIDRSKPTIRVLKAGATIGQRTHLSPFDIREIQLYYGCTTGGSTQLTTPAPPTLSPVVAAETCTFEKDYCGWTNPGGDQMNWIRRSGSTPSAGTGPSTDHSGSSTGHYAYLEASSHFNQKGYLLSPSYPAGYYCLSIYYHMYGANEGQLKIEAITGNTRRIIHTVSGNQGNQWHHYLLNIHVNTAHFQIEIEGDTGPGYRSDIAVDDITVHKGQCSTLQTGR